ncbi:hypothetical protein BH11PSE7_BH11PSE7_01990 [soil metagenome]
MTLDERRQVRRLATAVAVKLVVLAVLWWAFFNDVPIPADAEMTATHLGVKATLPGAPH